MKPSRLHRLVRYFKPEVRFIGVKTPAFRVVARAIWPRLQDRPIREVILEAIGLLRSPFMEERQVGAEARRGRHSRTILAVCAGLVANRERFSQLGMGWLLREFSCGHRDRVVAFLGRYLAQVDREALRYAAEKLPGHLRASLLEEHRAAHSGAAATPFGDRRRTSTEAPEAGLEPATR